MKIKFVFLFVFLLGKTEATLIHGFKFVGDQIEIIGLGAVDHESKDVTVQHQTFNRLIRSIKNHRDTLILCEIKKEGAARLNLYKKSFITEAVRSLTRGKNAILRDQKNVRLKGADIRSEASEIFSKFLVLLPTLKTVILENQASDQGHYFRRQLAFDLLTTRYDHKDICAFISSNTWKADLQEKLEKLHTKFLSCRKDMPAEMVFELEELLKRLNAAFTVYGEFIPKKIKTPKDLVTFLDAVLSDHVQYQKFLHAAHCLNNDIVDCGLALILWDEITKYRNNPVRIVMLNNVKHTVFMQRFINNILKFACVTEFGTPDIDGYLASPNHLTPSMLEELFACCATCGAGCTQDGKSVWRKSDEAQDFYCSYACFGEYDSVHELARLVGGLRLNKTLVNGRRKLYLNESSIV